jgi:type-F conjugative transfer system pilin assembly protein TrbC
MIRFIFFIIININVLANTNTYNITLPKISDEIKAITKQNIDNLNKARIDALQIKKPQIELNFESKIQDITNTTKQNVYKQQKGINQLLNKTVHNPKWKLQQKNLVNNLSSQNNADNKNNLSGDRLYFFISSSIPKNKVRKYIRQLSKYPQSQVLLRGFIGGAKKIKPTIAYIKSIIRKDESCLDATCPNYNVAVNIDPVLFRRYDITQVPALVYVDNISGANYCSEGNQSLVNVSGVKKFTGTAPLKYMLRELGVDND